MRKLLTIVAAAAAALAVAAGVSVAGGVAGKPVLTIGCNGFDTNPLDGLNYTKYLMYESFLRLMPDGSFKPALATSWHYMGAAHKDFTFTLRHNARYSDGSPVTAKTVKAWLDFNVAKGGTWAALLGAPVRSIDAVGKWTVQLHLKSPVFFAPLALSDLFGAGPASPQRMKDKPWFSNHSDGAGEYIVDPSGTVGTDHVTLIPNKYYYDKSQVHWSKIVIKNISDDTARLNALASGQIDFYCGGQSPGQAVAQASTGKYTIIAGPVDTKAIWFVAPKGTPFSDALKDVRVRQALNYAVDRKTISRAILTKYAFPTAAFITPDAWGDSKLANAFPYNPAKAKALLAAAGYANGLTLNSSCWTQDGPSCLLVDAAAKYFSAVGVKLNITARAEAGPFFNDYSSGEFSTWVAGFPVSIPLATEWQAVVQQKGAVGWNDKVAESLWYRGLHASTVKKSQELMTQLNRRITEQAYLGVPIAVSFLVNLANKRVTNIGASYIMDVFDVTQWLPTS